MSRQEGVALKIKEDTREIGKTEKFKPLNIISPYSGPVFSQWSNCATILSACVLGVTPFIWFHYISRFLIWIFKCPPLHWVVSFVQFLLKIVPSICLTKVSEWFCSMVRFGWFIKLLSVWPHDNRVYRSMIGTECFLNHAIVEWLRAIIGKFGKSYHNTCPLLSTHSK